MENLRKLINLANKASDSYYNKGREIMTNKEFDDLLDLIESEEKLQGLYYKDSPLRNVGMSVDEPMATAWKSVKHEFPALSLAKTKDISKFVKDFMDYDKLSKHLYSNEAVLMWKLDGSTVVATYVGGVLNSVVTRGNGFIGSDVTKNARYLKGLPLELPINEKTIIRGEVLMTQSDFEAVNANLPKDSVPYENARNLATASLHLTNETELANRPLIFQAFNLVYKESGFLDVPTFDSRLFYMKNLGISTVEYELVKLGDLQEHMEQWSSRVSNIDIPVDGLVVASNAASEVDGLPGTAKAPHIMKGYAFKWEDAEMTTTLKDIQWSLGRTGVLSPVAVFDKVFLEGSYVSKASVHNVSCIEDLDLRIGDKIAVYKANKIIPQISKNLNKGQHNDAWHIDIYCPECGDKAVIETGGSSETKVARCVNDKCPGKLSQQITYYCSKECANINGLSTETVSKLVRAGVLGEISDVYHLEDNKDISQEIVGVTNYYKLLSAVELSRDINFESFITALGIPNIGKTQAKALTKYLNDCKEDDKDILYWFFMLLDNSFDFSSLKGFGTKANESIYSVFDGNVISDYVLGELETPIGRLMNELNIIDI